MYVLYKVYTYRRHVDFGFALLAKPEREATF